MDLWIVIGEGGCWEWILHPVRSCRTHVNGHAWPPRCAKEADVACRPVLGSLTLAGGDAPSGSLTWLRFRPASLCLSLTYPRLRIRFQVCQGEEGCCFRRSSSCCVPRICLGRFPFFSFLAVSCVHFSACQGLGCMFGRSSGRYVFRICIWGFFSERYF